MRHSFSLLVFLLLSMTWNTSWGEAAATGDTRSAPPISTDRPSFTPSTSVIPHNHVQLELGAEYAHGDGQHSARLPALWLRYGLPAGTELRIAIPNAAMNWRKENQEARPTPDSNSPASHSYWDATVESSDWSVGIKHGLAVHESLTLAVMPAVLIPTTFGHEKERGISIAVDLAWSLSLSEALALAGIFGAALNDLGGRDGASFDSRAAIMLSTPLTEKLAVFAETFITYQQHDDSARPHADLGLSWLVRPRIQLDFFTGLELTAPKNIFAGAGLATIF